MAFSFDIRAASIAEAEGLAAAKLATALVEQPDLAPQSAALSAAITAYLGLASEPEPGRAIIVSVHGSRWLETGDQLGGIGGGVNISYGHLEDDSADSGVNDLPEPDAAPMAPGGRGIVNNGNA